MRVLKLNFQILIHARTRFACPAVVDRFAITRTRTLSRTVVTGIVWKITLTCVQHMASTVVVAGCGFHRPPRLPLILSQNRHYAMCPDMCQAITADLCQCHS